MGEARPSDPPGVPAMPQRIWAAATALLALCASPSAAPALVKDILPLNRVLASQELIFVATVEKVFPEKPGMVLTAGPALKGKVAFTRMPVNLSGDPEGKREKHPAAIQKRLAAGTEIVVFANKVGDHYEAFGFTNGTWFQMIGHGDKPEDVKWLFTH